MTLVRRAGARGGTILFFLATAVAGLVARQVLGARAVIEALFGPENYLPIEDALRFVSFPTMAVAAVAGLLLPRRFWLWAIAAPCLMPPELVFWTYYPAARAGVIGPSDYFGLTFFEANILVVLVVLCVVCSGVGAFLRTIAERILRGVARWEEGDRVNAEGHRPRRSLTASRPVGSFVATARGVLVEPARFFAGLGESREERNVWGALIFAVVCLLVYTLLSSLAGPLDPLASEGAGNRFYDLFSQASGDPWIFAFAIVFGLAALPVLVVLSLYLLAVVQHLLVLVFVRERSGFRATFLVVAYSVGAISLLSWVPVLGYLAELYRIYVFTIGLKELHGTTTTRALLATLFPLLLALAWRVYSLF